MATVILLDSAVSGIRGDGSQTHGDESMSASASSATQAPATRMPRQVPLLAVALVLAACTSPSVPVNAGGESPSVSPVASGSASVEIAGRYDMGEGRKLYLECAGSGSPTILLESGDNSDLSQWRTVVPGLMTETRVCRYDRAGIGQSSDATGCRQMDDLLGDLENLLAKAGIDGPYVLVGTSGGGFLMAGYAMRHPDQVQGIVLVETPKALTAELYPDIVPQIACDAPGNVEHRDYVTVEHEAWDNRREIGNFPMTVISNDWGDQFPAGTDESTNVEDQREWLVLTSAEGRQVVVTSGHDVAVNEPDLVVDEILAVLDAARAN
jgi:pimeloyl-ACP methyl ester carboxylesterase